MKEVMQTAIDAKNAGTLLQKMSAEEKNTVLKEIAKALVENTNYIIAKNKIDVDNAREKGRTSALIDRLALTEKRIADMAQGVLDIASLKDPTGEILSGDKRPNGIVITKKRVPLGVVGIIYEARPNVTSDAVAICLKSGNTVVLKGGSEAIYSNTAIVEVMREAGKKSGLPKGAIGFISNTSRDAAEYMMKLNGYIDVLIPRGGGGLIQSVVKNATIPVIETGVGNCHVFVDDSADFKMATDIIINAKTQRPAVCNACESVLIHENIANIYIEKLFSALEENNVEIRGCKQCTKYGCALATEDDYATEFLDLTISVKVVKDINEAICHINKYGTHHSDAIITADYTNSRKFTEQVDSAAVYVNASTRFTDGFEFGFGAEIGISTQKLHARGPMGLCELTSYKYIVEGEGQIR